MTRTLTAIASLFLIATSAHAGRPKCDDSELAEGLSRLAATNELQRAALASVIVAKACNEDALADAVQATLHDQTALLIEIGEAEPRLWDRVCPNIEPNQVTSEFATTGCSVAHLGWSNDHFASSMTAAAMSDDATAAPFQFSSALAAQQVGRALSAQTVARSRSAHRQAYLDAMAPVSTVERQQRAIRTATAGLAGLSRRPQQGPLLSGPGGLTGTRDTAPAIAGLATGSIIVLGSLDAALIHDTFRPIFPALRACTTDTGDVTVRIQINRDGSVGQASIHATTLPDANTCILDIVRPLQFPEAASNNVITTYPLEFRNPE